MSLSTHIFSLPPRIKQYTSAALRTINSFNRKQPKNPVEPVSSTLLQPMYKLTLFSVYMCVCVYVRVYMCIYVCIYVRICVYM